MAVLLGTSLDDLRTYDTRPAIDEVKRRAALDPAFGFALRRIANLSQDELRQIEQLLERQGKRGKK